MPYKVESRTSFIGNSATALQDHLNDMDKEGWDLVTVLSADGCFNGTFIFKKRPCSHCNDMKEVAVMDPDGKFMMIPCSKCNRDAFIKYTSKEVEDG